MLPRSPHAFGPSLVLVSSFVLATLIAVAQENTKDLNVGVRSDVAAPAKSSKSAKSDKSPPVTEGGKIYGIVSVMERRSQEKLVKPVDPEMIARELDTRLTAEGFTRMVKGQKPDLVISAEYGRSWLPNPYMGSTRGIENQDGGAPTVTIAGSDIGQLVRQKELGMEEKIQRASYEKLFIEVTAWKYPESPTAKPQKLWNLLMNVDDPDHRDLNGVFKEMFAAGAPYFGRKVAGPEVEVRRALPEGRVDLGTPVVVPTAAPTKDD